jgi:hypothetical protein
MQAQTAPWAVILAGGEGTRLRPLTQRLTGEDVGWCDLGNPKRVVESARRRGHAPSWLAEAASLTA